MKCPSQQIFQIEIDLTKYPMKKKFMATGFKSAYEVMNHKDAQKVGSTDEELPGFLRSIRVEASEVEGTFYILANYDLLP